MMWRSIIRRRAVRCLALAACAVLALAAKPAAAEPALWVARSDTATVYLFGTFHAVRPGAQWQSPKLSAALGAAKALWLEDADLDHRFGIAVLTGYYGMDLLHPLPSKLSPEQLRRVDAALRAMGVKSGAAGVKYLRPWLVALMLSSSQLRGDGLDVAHGADITLKAQAEAAHLPVKGLESNEQQVRILADLPRDAELAFLDGALQGVETGPALTLAMFDAWLAGDVAKLDRMLRETDTPQWEAGWRAIFGDRNRAFAARIAALLHGRETVLLAVGAGHFAGPGNVLSLLAEQGVTVERVQ